MEEQRATDRRGQDAKTNADVLTKQPRPRTRRSVASNKRLLHSSGTVERRRRRQAYHKFSAQLRRLVIVTQAKPPKGYVKISSVKLAKLEAYFVPHSLSRTPTKVPVSRRTARATACFPAWERETVTWTKQTRPTDTK